MLQPRSWHVVETPAFEKDFARLEPGAERLEYHRRAFKFFLERSPFEFAQGLTRDDDELRICVSTDHHEGAEYVAGVQIDRAAQVVSLVWLERRQADI